MQSVKIKDRIIRVGDILIANQHARDRGICDSGTKVTVQHIKRCDGEVIIGLRSFSSISGWHDLDGMLSEPGYGYWAHTQSLTDNFEPTNEEYTVGADYSYKGRNLLGMHCKRVVMNTMPGVVFVQMDEDIGGGSADGQGKNGHCIPVPTDVLRSYKKTAKRSKEAK